MTIGKFIERVQIKMGNFFEEYRNRRKHEFFKYVSPNIRDRFESGNEMDVEEYYALVANSYERRLLFPLFSDRLLVKQLKYAMDQASYTKLPEFSIPKHYNHAIERLYLPELIERFENLLKEKK